MRENPPPPKIEHEHFFFFLNNNKLTRSQNNNLERALDWIFIHPEQQEEESDALSDGADTQPNDNAFSNGNNTHSDSTLSPDRGASGPRVKDGPGREWLCIILLIVAVWIFIWVLILSLMLILVFFSDCSWPLCTFKLTYIFLIFLCYPQKHAGIFITATAILLLLCSPLYFRQDICYLWNTTLSDFVFPASGYELFAFISHMGASTMSGHYVCHIKKEGRWAAHSFSSAYSFRQKILIITNYNYPVSRNKCFSWSNLKCVYLFFGFMNILFKPSRKNKWTHFLSWQLVLKQVKRWKHFPRYLLPLQVGDLQRPQSVFVRKASKRLGLHLLLPSTV